MSTLYITEYKNATMAGLAAISNAFPLPAPLNPPLAEQHVAIGSGSVKSAAFNDSTTFVMVNCDQACSLAWGTDPTAVATAQRMGPNETRFYGVPAGGAYKVAVIQNT